MAKVDLHVHSKYSEHAAEWFLQKIGARESYTEPEEVYRKAKAAGMRFVTLTDHNQIDGSLYLKARYPKEAFTGVEFTTYFPEDGCKIHLLVYGLTRNDFQECDRLRTNIYTLRNYVRDRGLPYSVAHAAYAVNNRLTREHLEKLILLFDVFEGINGSRDACLNQAWMQVLDNLTPAVIDRLVERYGIEPISETPWVKGFTGGSDDHSSLFIGRTYTEIGAASPEDFLDTLRNKLTLAGGRHNDYQTFVFNIYKIAHDFSKSGGLHANPWLRALNDLVFHGKALSWFRRMSLRAAGQRGNGLGAELADLAARLQNAEREDHEAKLKVVYDKLADVADGFVRNLLNGLTRDLRQGDVFTLFRDLSSLLTGAFLATPFFSSLSHLYQGRHLLARMLDDYVPPERRPVRKILWFTDTIADLNGVSASLQTMGRAAQNRSVDLQIAVSVDPATAGQLPSWILPLPACHTLPLPNYDPITLRVPSLLKALETIYQARPDKIILSTPGPVGWLGLLAARVLHVETVGIYHTDFAAQVQALSGEEDLAQFVEQGLKWFYSALDEIRVPTRTYLTGLRDRGYPPEKLRLYRKGLDMETFTPHGSPDATVRRLFRNPDDFLILYAGRLSRDKDIEALLSAHRELRREGVDINVVLVGDGPEVAAVKKAVRGTGRVKWIGKKAHQALPAIYRAADLFVFPSRTDTFGLAVLEAQACGVPALVSDVGGPQEIIRHGETGWRVKSDEAGAWARTIRWMYDVWKQTPDAYQAWRQRARERAEREFRLEYTLTDLLESGNQEPRNDPDARWVDGLARLAGAPSHATVSG